MAERISTRKRLARIRDNMAQARIANSRRRRREQACRERRMKQLILQGQYPYLPAVQSWLSARLGVPFSRITEAQARQVAESIPG